MVSNNNGENIHWEMRRLCSEVTKTFDDPIFLLVASILRKLVETIREGKLDENRERKYFALDHDMVEGFKSSGKFKILDGKSTTVLEDSQVAQLANMSVEGTRKMIDNFVDNVTKWWEEAEHMIKSKNVEGFETFYMEVYPKMTEYVEYMFSAEGKNDEDQVVIENLSRICRQFDFKSNKDVGLRLFTIGMSNAVFLFDEARFMFCMFVAPKKGGISENNLRRILVKSIASYDDSVFSKLKIPTLLLKMSLNLRSVEKARRMAEGFCLAGNKPENQDVYIPV